MSTLHDRPKCLETCQYQDFVPFLETNIPVLFAPEATASWPAFTRFSANNAFNYLEFKNLFGYLDIQVVDCSAGFACEKQKFQDLLDVWERGEGKSLYAKDLHLPLELCKKGKKISDELYVVPDAWRDDWINSYSCLRTNNDFRFVYIGGQQSFTPLHRDVYCSYSISTNVSGSKQWWLFPPSCTPDLLPLIKQKEYKDSYVDVTDWDAEQLQHFKNLGMQVFIQQEGETIFVPSGYYHQVCNLTHPTLSINHNWANSYNLSSLHDTMCEEIASIEESVSDVREILKSTQPLDWEEEWTRIIDAIVTQNIGWGWSIFWEMVYCALSTYPEFLGQPQPSGERLQWPSRDRTICEPYERVKSKVEHLLAQKLFSPHDQHLPGLRETIENIQNGLRLS